MAPTACFPCCVLKVFPGGVAVLKIGRASELEVGVEKDRVFHLNQPLCFANAQVVLLC